MNNDKLYNMKLHETIVVSDNSLFTTVLRVPGGWIYSNCDKGHGILASVFVRFDNEFQEVEDGQKQS